MPWYVIYTKPNNEKKVTKYLLARGIDVFCPTYQEVRQWSDRKKIIDTPLFKSYLFVQLMDYNNDYASILSTQGVVRFIWWIGKPAIVKDNEIEEIKKFLSIYKTSKIIVDLNIHAGDSIKVKTGPLVGQNGRLVSIKGKNAVLELNSLGCKLVALVSLNNIELANK